VAGEAADLEEDLLAVRRGARRRILRARRNQRTAADERRGECRGRNRLELLHGTLLNADR
jgi:hypothetical protein